MYTTVVRPLIFVRRLYWRIHYTAISKAYVCLLYVEVTRITQRQGKKSYCFAAIRISDVLPVWVAPRRNSQLRSSNKNFSPTLITFFLKFIFYLPCGHNKSSTVWVTAGPCSTRKSLVLSDINKIFITLAAQSHRVLFYLCFFKYRPHQALIHNLLYCTLFF